MFENDFHASAMNRIYYSMFYAVQALLILKGSTFSKHGQVKGFFNREFIKKAFSHKNLVGYLTLYLNTVRNSITSILSPLKGR